MNYRKKAEARLRALGRSLDAQPARTPEGVTAMYGQMSRQFRRKLDRDLRKLNDRGVWLAAWALRAMESE